MRHYTRNVPEENKKNKKNACRAAENLEIPPRLPVPGGMPHGKGMAKPIACPHGYP